MSHFNISIGVNATEIINGKNPSIIVANLSILDVCEGLGYAFDISENNKQLIQQKPIEITKHFENFN